MVLKKRNVFVDRKRWRKLVSLFVSRTEDRGDLTQSPTPKVTRLVTQNTKLFKRFYTFINMKKMVIGVLCVCT